MNHDDIFKHAAILASAGTGKTYQLTNRFLALLASGEKPGRILATTFSVKAAGEIFERIVRRLVEAAESDSQANQLSNEIGIPDLTADRCSQLLAELMHQCHRLKIGTMDSIFHQIAGAFAIEIGLPIGWQIGEGQQDAVLRTQSIRAVLDNHKPEQLVALIRLLNKGEYRRSVTEQLIEAINKMYSLYLSAPDEKSWGWFPKFELLDQPTVVELVGQLREYTADIDKRFAKARADNVKSFLAGDWVGFIGKGLAGKIVVNDPYYFRKPIPEKLLRLYEPLVEHAKGCVIRELSVQTRTTHRLLQEFGHEYRQRQIRKRQFRFEDITHILCDQSLTDQLEEIYYRLDGRFHHLLIDEFQDTSLEQWRILLPFVQEITACEPGEKSFFCVGDMKQAIYGWRGGETRLFSTFAEQFYGSVEEKNLDVSYRSSPVIIGTVNQVFNNLPENEAIKEAFLPVVEKWHDVYHPHQTARTELPGYCTLEVTPAGEPIDEQKQKATQYAADRIAGLVETCPHYTIGVLVRTNKAIGRLIYQLRCRGISASEEGGNPLTDSPAVETVLSLLLLADHPGNKMARFHVEAGPLGEVVGLTNWQDDQQVRQVTHSVRRMLIDQGYGVTVYEWATAMAPNCNQRDFGRLMQLVELAHLHDECATLRPGDFVESIRLKKVESSSTAQVRVMTINQSKGLQFDVVVLPELDVRLIGNPPAAVASAQSMEGEIEKVSRYPNQAIQTLLPDLQDLVAEHERRSISDNLSLLYVALTRAVYAMHMIVWPGGKSKKRVASGFGAIIEQALCQQSHFDDNAGIVWEQGDPNWFEQLDKKPTAVQEEVTMVLEPKLAENTEQVRRGLLRRSPSELEGGTTVSLADYLQLEANPAQKRGTVIHRWFELINWLDQDGLPDETVLRDEAARLHGSPQEITQWLEQFNEMLAVQSIRDVLSLSHYAPDATIEKERRFMVRLKQTVMTGSIDRLVLEHDSDGHLARAYVQDYKTDSSSKPVDQIVEHYKPQLNAYRQAVAKLYKLNLDQIVTQLILLRHGEVVGIDWIDNK